MCTRVEQHRQLSTYQRFRKHNILYFLFHATFYIVFNAYVKHFVCEKCVSKRKYCVIILLYRLFFLCNCNYRLILVKEVERINGICVNIFITYINHKFTYFLRFFTLLI